MTIERITLTHVRIPLVEPFRISNGVVSEKDAIIVTLQSDGLLACGEASPMSGSFYSNETPESTWVALVNVLIPRVCAEKPQSVAGISRLLDRFGGDPFARAGIETAFWDLEAQRKGTPLFASLGGTRDAVDCGLAVGIYPRMTDLLAAIEKHLCEGYKRVKIKIRPGWDLEPLREIRKRFGATPLMADANCAYTPADIPHLRALDEFGLMMVEQPMSKDDLEGHAKLQAVLATPVCLDEGATDSDAVRRAIELGSCRIVNIKIQRVGGLTHAVEMHDLCAGAGIPVWGGTMPELGIGGAQTLHLSTLSNFLFPTDVESSLRWFVDDIIEPLIEVHNGKARIPAGTGNCYRLNSSKVKKYTLREQIF